MLAGAAPLIAALEDFQIQAVSLRRRRDALVASAQAATRQVNAAFAAGRSYGIKPIRQRRATHGSCGLPN